MSVPTIRLGGLEVSKLIIGGNPFSGFSHQRVERDREMKRYYTVERIKATLRHAESLGVNTIVARADNHIGRILLEYWAEGGTIQWIAQTCSEISSLRDSIGAAAAGGAKGCYVHGGKMDWALAKGDMSEAVAGVEWIRQAGMVVGVGAHRPKVLAWAEETRLDVDFYMCSYYDPTPRDYDPVHNPNAPESWLPEDRDRMLRTIAGLSRPALHYKVLAGGNADVAESMAVAAEHLRPQDAVVIGVFLKDKPDMIEEDIRLLFDGADRDERDER